MTVISFRTENTNGSNLLKIELSDGSMLLAKNCYLDDYIVSAVSFGQGREINAAEEEALRFAADCYRAECHGMRLIARAEQTRTGLSHKLKGKGHASACVSAVISRFMDLDLVNDERYAERWLRNRLSRRGGKIPGPRRLSAALGNRGIGGDAIREAFDKTLDEEAEFVLLRKFLTKNRIGGISGNYSLRGRLKYEGFSSPVINRYFDENIQNNLII